MIFLKNLKSGINLILRGAIWSGIPLREKSMVTNSDLNLKSGFKSEIRI
jgi:hypothetical protein